MTQETRPDGAELTPADSGRTGSEVVGLASLLGEELGKSFASDEAALEYVKGQESFAGKVKNYAPFIEKLETKYGSQSHVVKIMEDALNPSTASNSQPAVDENKFVSRDQYEADTFYATKPEYSEFRDVISAMRKDTGKSLPEVVELPSFKNIFEKAKVGNEYQQSRSVLQTNPRLGQVRNKMSEAVEAAKAGDESTAARLATEGVLEAYDMK